MKTNIPIYRAKMLDKDEWVEGYLHIVPETVDIGYADIEKGNYIFSNTDGVTAWEIDTETLSINFPNMLDKNGKKIFASLSKDGVGGDIVHDVEDDIKTFMFFEDSFFILFEAYSVSFTDMRATLEVIGIHKGE